MRKEASKKNWAITSSAFDRLLTWLDDGGETSGGRKYLEMRERLVAYFDRKNCRDTDELADETLNRVARRLAEEKHIESETPAKYCYIVARFVFLESLRNVDKTHVALDDVMQKNQERQIVAADVSTEKGDHKEKMLECLESCVGKLEAGNREIILNYYFGIERVKIENRRTLAQKLNISSNALTIRACRIRDKLEVCVKNCAGEK